MKPLADPQEHQNIEPKILYYGMPVILVTTRNEDGTTNISPNSSSWALGHYVVLGFGTGGKAVENLQHTPELVINVPGYSLWQQVEQLAPLTGKDPVPEHKAHSGFSYEKDKFGVACFHEQASETVGPGRIRECPLQLECIVKRMTIPDYAPGMTIVETQVQRVHAIPEIISRGSHIDPERWNPLIYNFRHYFPLGEQLGRSYRSET